MILLSRAKEDYQDAVQMNSPGTDHTVRVNEQLKLFGTRKGPMSSFPIIQLIVGALSPLNNHHY